MEAIKDQYTELRSSHDDHMRTIENMQQINKQQMMEWDNERNKLVCFVLCYGIVYVLLSIFHSTVYVLL